MSSDTDEYVRLIFCFGFFLWAAVMEENNEQVTTMYSSHVRLSENLSHHLSSITQ